MPVACRALLIAACAAALLAACRDRQVALLPAVTPAGRAHGEPPADAVAVAPDLLRGATVSTLCSFDSAGEEYVQGKVAIDRARAVRLRGWFADPGHAAIGAFRLVLAGDAATWALPARTGAPRPDVADYFHDPRMGTAGFDQLSDLSAVPPGDYRIVLLSDGSGRPVACDSGKRLALQ
jgi:hypothetical protein